jgi:TonB family protein
MAAPAVPSPRFVMVVAPASRAQNGTSAGSAVAAAATAGESAAAEPAAEALVDTPAKLLAGASPSYTLEAQAAGIEADIPFEIVVDSTGAVLSARALAHVGYGLDEAALRSVRAARFSPARRAGKALAVRMPWLMRFQLR